MSYGWTEINTEAMRTTIPFTRHKNNMIYMDNGHAKNILWKTQKEHFTPSTQKDTPKKMPGSSLEYETLL